MSDYWAGNPDSNLRLPSDAQCAAPLPKSNACQIHDIKRKTPDSPRTRGVARPSRATQDFSDTVDGLEQFAITLVHIRQP
ncbi:protein of unknown function [Magnetospirillum sp. XM-1]|nr:protein of unknown function [Magnetospirillum sp. XM-1]